MAAMALLATLPACTGPGGGREADLRIVSGSENQTLEPLIQRFADEQGVSITVDYRGSVDIMLGLQGQAGEFDYDAVWPAASLWLDLGDTQGLVDSAESITRSPIVFGVKRSVAERLGWVGADVTVSEMLAATESGDLRFMMTSASQSNSGASAYLGFLHAFAGSPEVLQAEDLQRPEVRDGVTRILGEVDRSSGSSGWLKDLFLREYDDFDAMVNYESVVIETNQELVAQGREPLYAVYPVDGLAISDSPLATSTAATPTAPSCSAGCRTTCCRPRCSPRRWPSAAASARSAWSSPTSTPTSSTPSGASTSSG
jgi:Ca-activated chloride channel family protein